MLRQREGKDRDIVTGRRKECGGGERVWVQCRDKERRWRETSIQIKEWETHREGNEKGGGCAETE